MDLRSWIEMKKSKKRVEIEVEAEAESAPRKAYLLKIHDEIEKIQGNIQKGRGKEN